MFQNKKKTFPLRIATVTVKKVCLIAYLEEHRLPVLALWAGVVLGPREGGVADDVGDDVGELVDLVHDLVDVDAVVVGDLFVVAVAAGVHQDAVLLVLLRVQHVVALLRRNGGRKREG